MPPLTFAVGDRVRVTPTRAHIHNGRVLDSTPTGVRVQFPTGGSGGRPYTAVFPPTKLQPLTKGKNR